MERHHPIRHFENAMAVVSDNCVSVSIRLSKSYFTSPLTLILSDEGATDGLKSLLCLGLPKDLRLSLRCVGKNVVARRLAAGKYDRNARDDWDDISHERYRMS